MPGKTGQSGGLFFPFFSVLSANLCGLKITRPTHRAAKSRDDILFFLGFLCATVSGEYLFFLYARSLPRPGPDPIVFFCPGAALLAAEYALLFMLQYD